PPRVRWLHADAEARVARRRCSRVLPRDDRRGVSGARTAPPGGPPGCPRQLPSAEATRTRLLLRGDRAEALQEVHEKIPSPLLGLEQHVQDRLRLSAVGRSGVARPDAGEILDGTLVPRRLLRRRGLRCPAPAAVRKLLSLPQRTVQRTVRGSGAGMRAGRRCSPTPIRLPRRATPPARAGIDDRGAVHRQAAPRLNGPRTRVLSSQAQAS